MNVRLLLRGLGLAGSLACIVIYIRDPSWPTPDKLLVFLTFVFMAVSQAKSMLKHLGPLVAIMLVYEMFRGLVPSLNTHVNYTPMISADHLISNTLPTTLLQQWFWQGHVMWYDFALYGTYMLHFVLPLGLVILLWKFHDSHYWRAASTYLTVSFAAFFTFLLFPAAPPWMAARDGYIEPITRVSGEVFGAMGIHDFPSVYNKIAANPVAAVPSLHSAYAMLLVIFVWRYFGRKWGLLAGIYPLLIWFGTVYMGEHYIIDEVLGVAYAVGGYLAVYWFADHVSPRIKAYLLKQKKRWQLDGTPTKEPVA